MLEIRNIRKTYRSKKGVETRALDGVSLSFPERGLVFLLGKSGSGKSTLLNICGGLDRPDEGEIVIRGRSSKDFSAEDFDSYRNTCVGFVFQEYNVLNEFSVEDNVALALELQNKKRDPQEIRRILRIVEMEDFAKRKPNTLSGGQKQRVAIARALVKDPQIILADEPTGALDSETGRQVLDTLKKLSGDKLVIVVSHDREFAEQYADRIVELKDGKVISDVTRTGEATALNVRFCEDTVSVRDCARLTEEDFAAIRRFLSSSKGGAAISCNRQEVAALQDTLPDAGGQFTQTVQPPPRRYAADEQKLIRSHMPFRHAFRMGASCVRLRPLRLTFTILLSFLAFTLFGLFSTLTFYDPVETAVRTYLDADYETVMLEDNYRFRQVTFRGTELYDEADFTSSALFTPADVETLREQFGSSVIACFDYSESYSGQDFGIENAGAVGVQSYYSTILTFFAELSEDTSYWDAHLLTDTDLSALGEDEIVITAYTFAGLQHGGLTDEDGEEIPLNDYDDIVGQKITIRGNTMDAKGELTVRGVLDLDLPDEFEAIEGNMDAKERSTLINERDALLAHGLYAAGFVSPGFYDAHSEAFLQRRTSVDLTEYFSFELSGGISVHAAGSEESGSIRYISYLPIRYGKSPDFTLFDEGKDSLSDGEIALPFYLLRPQVQAMAEAERAAIAQREGEAAAQEFAEAMERDIDYLTDGSHLITESDEATGEIISRERIYADAEQLQAALDAVSALIGRYEETDYALCRTYSLQSRNGTALGDFRLAGFLYGKVSYEHDAAYFSEADCLSIAQSSELSSSLNSTEITAYSFPADARYRGCAVAVPTETGKLRELLRAAGQVDEANDTFFTVGSPVSEELEILNSIVDMLGNVFLALGIVMAVLAMLLLANFISVSIIYKKREIGILRALGARSADVFKIFYSESAIIAGTCFLLSMIACFVTCAVLNATLAGVLPVSAFVFGPLSWLVMLGIALVTSVAATFLPVYSIAKRSPVESIRAL